MTHALALRDGALITDGKRLCRRRRRRRCGEGAGGEGAPSSMSARDLGSPTYFPQFPCAKVSVTPDGEERYIDGEVRF